MIGKENSEVKPELSEKEQKRKMLKAKINMMRQDRTNSVYHRARANENVSSEILSEYMKLKQISKMPIPEPNEILANPEEYKPVIAMVLQNSMMKQLSSSHPYVRYFRLIAEKLGVDMPLPMPTQDFLTGNKIQEKIVEITGNEMSKDADTDTEEEAINV